MIGYRSLRDMVGSLLQGSSYGCDWSISHEQAVLLGLELGGHGKPFSIQRFPLWYRNGPLAGKYWQTQPMVFSRPVPVDESRTAYALRYWEQLHAPRLSLWLNPQPEAGLEARLDSWLGEPMPETWLVLGGKLRGNRSPVRELELDTQGRGFYGSFRIAFPGTDLTTDSILAEKLCNEGVSRFDMLLDNHEHQWRLNSTEPPAPELRLVGEWEGTYLVESRLYIYFRSGGHSCLVESSYIQLDYRMDMVALLASLCGYTQLSATDHILLLASHGLAASELSQSVSEPSRLQFSPLLVTDMLSRMEESELQQLLDRYNARFKSPSYRFKLKGWLYAGSKRYPLIASNVKSMMSLPELYHRWYGMRSDLLPPSHRLCWESFNEAIGSQRLQSEIAR